MIDHFLFSFMVELALLVYHSDFQLISTWQIRFLVSLELNLVVDQIGLSSNKQ